MYASVSDASALASATESGLVRFDPSPAVLSPHPFLHCASFNGRGQGGDSRDAVLSQKRLVWTGFFASPQLLGKGGPWYRVLLIACRFEYFLWVMAWKGWRRVTISWRRF